MKIKLFYILVIVSILLIGCEQPPLTEMENAREAVFRAENDSNAVEYAGGTLARARDSLRRMQEEADNKRYDAARTYASDAISTADRAIAEGRIAAQRVGGESDSLISTLRDEIEETFRNVNGARYSQLNLDYDSLDRTIMDAYNTADQAEADQAAGRHQQALDRARVVRSDLSDVNQSIAAAASARKK
ncbi:MAG: DUF4398 domain-containing protein [Treponema sp.]|nr:DUF4398 domain-containing protein [Treponema sp.]